MEYERTVTIDAAPEQVWSLVADPASLPAWLVRTTEADSPGPDLVHLTRETEGHPYELEGLFRAQPEQRRVEWGSRGVGDYAGWLQIADAGEGRCSVTLHLSFLAGQPEAHGGAPAAAVDTDLARSLDQLAAACAGV